MNYKEYADYFSLPDIFEENFESDALGSAILHTSVIDNNPSLEGISIALIGLTETRSSKTEPGFFTDPDIIRKRLFHLKNHHQKVAIADLGNLKNGKTVSDTYSAIAIICAELIRIQILPVIIGGTQDSTFGQYCAYKQLAQIINIANVDFQFDLGESTNEINSRSFVGKIILEQPNYLFNYSHIGHQLYFVGEDAVEKMKKLFFDTYRLGQVRADIIDTEPVLRNSDLLTFDLSAIRQADCPGTTDPSPNGLSAEESCQIMFYAGLSEKITSVGLYEFKPDNDRNFQTANLLAQMIWYFIEGFSKRKNEMPAYNRNGFLKYIVTLSEMTNEIVFLKSPRTDRWWTEIPIVDNYTKFQRHHIVPCSYNDYQMAMNNEMPERWWQTFKKLS